MGVSVIPSLQCSTSSSRQVGTEGSHRLERGAAWQKQLSSKGWAPHPLAGAGPYLSLSFSSINSWSIP